MQASPSAHPQRKSIRKTRDSPQMPSYFPPRSTSLAHTQSFFFSSSPCTLLQINPYLVAKRADFPERHAATCGAILGLPPLKSRNNPFTFAIDDVCLHPSRNHFAPPFVRPFADTGCGIPAPKLSRPTCIIACRARCVPRLLASLRPLSNQYLSFVLG